MTLEEMEAAFEAASEGSKFDDFDNLPAKRSPWRDIHAFLLLSEILPQDSAFKMVSAAEHDVIWLDVDAEKLAAVITPEQVVELDACGVFYDSGTDSLSMFV